MEINMGTSFEDDIMSLTKLGTFFEDDIKVKFKKNADLSYFENNGYCDYRCGCDLCETGDAYGFKTNIHISKYSKKICTKSYHLSRSIKTRIKSKANE